MSDRPQAVTAPIARSMLESLAYDVVGVKVISITATGEEIVIFSLQQEPNFQ